MNRKIKAKVLIDLQTNFTDEESDKNTIKYLLEQDLQDKGWQINNIKIRDDKTYIKHYIFGVVNSITFCWKYNNEGSARDIYLNLLSDFDYEYIIKVLGEIDCDMIDGFESFYNSEIKK